SPPPAPARGAGGPRQPPGDVHRPVPSERAAAGAAPGSQFADRHAPLAPASPVPPHTAPSGPAASPASQAPARPPTSAPTSPTARTGLGSSPPPRHSRIGPVLGLPPAPDTPRLSRLLRPAGNDRPPAQRVPRLVPALRLQPPERATAAVAT